MFLEDCGIFFIRICAAEETKRILMIIGRAMLPLDLWLPQAKKAKRNVNEELLIRENNTSKGVLAGHLEANYMCGHIT